MYHVHIVRPCGWGLEAPDVGTYLLLLGFNIGYENGRNHGNPNKQIAISQTQVSRARIPAARNYGVDEARKENATHLMMIDPDVAVDAFVGTEPWAKKWWGEAWGMMLSAATNWDIPIVVATPYAGLLHPPKVQVFYRDKTGKNRRYSWEDAGKKSGWESVNAVGSGLMLIDMRVFDTLDKQDDLSHQRRPYFRDLYTDERESELKYTPDIYFCERCVEAGIPIWVNWDCWCGHWQFQRVNSPRSVAHQIEGTEFRGKEDSPVLGNARWDQERGSELAEGGFRGTENPSVLDGKNQPDSPFGCSVCIAPWI